MPTVKETILHLKQLSPSGKAHVAVAIWQAEDVRGRAKELRIKLTKQQVDQVLDTIDRKWDAELGINWGLVDFFVQEIGTPYKSRK